MRHELGGLTSSKHQESSTEFYKKGAKHRYIAYGLTREEVLAQLQGEHGTSTDWEDKWVVMPTKTVRMGLGPQWSRVTRRYDREYHMI